jgi:phenylacetate-CoA ligase
LILYKEQKKLLDFPVEGQRSIYGNYIMNKFISKYAIIFPIQLFRGQNHRKYARPMKKQQYMQVQQVLDLGNRKVRQLLDYACKNVPYYKNVFNEKKILSDQLSGFDDLHRIPVLQKKELLEHEKELINPHFRKKLYLRKTGGSTGMTLHFWKEADALAKNDAVMFRCYGWYGIDIGDRQARFWGVPVIAKLRWKEQLKDFILNRIRISAFDISRESCLKQYERIRKFEPAYFYGYTTAIYGFCLHMKNEGINLNELHLKAVICTAEKMYPHHRNLFSEVFKCPVVDEYGSTENGIIAFQCKQGNMHIMADHLRVEFLDESDKPVKPGQIGRIVITDLSSFAMPMIRYDIGDRGSPSDRTCSCGVTLPLMDIMEGRKEDFIRTKEGKLIHAAYLCYTLKDDSVQEFKMYQTAIDTVKVQIVKSSLFNVDSEKLLESNLRTSLGNEMHILFEYLERIPREKSGKLRYFVSELSNSTSI